MGKAAKPAVRMPWDDIDLSASEIAALRNVRDGAADATQQRLAWAVIRDKVCNVDALSFTFAPDGVRVGDFAEGKRWVAKTMSNIANQPVPINPRGPEPPMPAPAE